MFKLLGLVHKAASVAVIGGVAWLGWQHLGPETPTVDPELADGAKEVISQVVRDLREHRGEIRHVALLRFEGDGSGAITGGIRTRIEFTGAFDLEGRALMTKARGHLNLREPAYSTPADALEEGRDLDVKGVVFGNVRRFEPVGEDQVAWDIDVGFADVASGKTLMQKTYTRDDSAAGAAAAPAETPDEAAAGYSWLSRCLAWVLLVLLLPVFTISFIRLAVSKKSNATNAFVLCLYTFVDAALACLLVEAALTTGFGITMLIVATLLAMAYNIRMMSYAVHLEEA